MAPEPCYFCRKPRDSYFGILCDECREKAAQLARNIEAARKPLDSKEDSDSGGT